MTAATSQWFSLPDLLAENLDSPFCINGSVVRSRRDLLAHALSVSELLPEKNYALNLCQDRYLFMVAFLAIMLKQQISLLPPNQTINTLADLLNNYPQSYIISDDDMVGNFDCLRLSNTHLTCSRKTFPRLASQVPVSISFTSGSTGAPKSVAKTLAEFHCASQLALEQLDFLRRQLTVVSTVPPQHMYGLETSFFWPLFSKLIIDNRRPFYPEDIRQCLQTVEGASILVATPTHLKALVQSDIVWPDIVKILSSTAPMGIDLAMAVEAKLGAPLYELFGSTETMSFATRRTARVNSWQCYSGVCLQEQAGTFLIQGGHLAQALVLDDRFELTASQQFTIAGRSADLIKIAGKRASLADLNARLNAIEGVEDGLFFETRGARLSVLVVSELSKQQLVAELKQSIDPVFLPKQVLRVRTLPRNSLGKINKMELEHLLGELTHD